MIYILSFSSLGDKIGEKLAEEIGGRLFKKSAIIKAGLSQIAEEAMENARGIIFISSTGIALRAVAPYLKGKTIDPGIVVVDAMGRFSISLLSGHLGGGNELALKIGDIINASPVITTATDALGIKAPDVIAKENGLLIKDMKMAKQISSLLIEGEKIFFKDEGAIIEMPGGYVSEESESAGKVIVTNRNTDKEALLLLRRNLILGIGCRKDTKPESLMEFVKAVFEEQGLLIEAICKIATVDLKSGEKAILNLSEELNVPLEIHSRDSIQKVEHLFKGSEFVKKSVGVRAVAEPCVHLSRGNILTGKIAKEGMTLCIGERIE